MRFGQLNTWRTAGKILASSRSIANSAVVPNPLPASFLRGGTSKGIFISSKHLPPNRSQWDDIFLKLMGSPDPYGRQLDGMGGGISSLSKIVVVGPPSGRNIAADVQYTFAQVGIKDSVVDYSGNCGNLSSMAGVFALDQGLVSPGSLKVFYEESVPMTTVACFNTNTQKVINTTFPVNAADNGTALLTLPQIEMAGVPGRASRITMDFISPGGAKTGNLLPSGSARDTLILKRDPKAEVEVSLVDAANPNVFIHELSLRSLLKLDLGQALDFTSEPVLSTLEDIRRAGASAMSLDPSVPSIPKIAVLSDAKGPEADIDVCALSMGVLHKAVPMTLGLCLGVAAAIPNSVPWKILRQRRVSAMISSEDQVYPYSQLVRISHPTGVVEVGADFDSEGLVTSAKVTRTGKRLMKGFVYC